MSDVAGNEVEIIVEWLAGDPQRYEWVEATGELKPVDSYRIPPAHYGCVPGAISAADGELLDVFLLPDVARTVGDRVRARLVGVLRRSDGDSKLLVVDPHHLPYTTVEDVPAEQLDAIWAWIPRQHVVLGWSGPEAAQAILDDSRRVWWLRRDGMIEDTGGSQIWMEP
jgi:inorganic pyrophosphatase